MFTYGHKHNLKFLVKWAHLYYDECTWEDQYLLKEKEVIQYFQLKVFESVLGTPQYEEEKKQYLKILWTPSAANRGKNQPIWLRGGTLHPF